jgi:hypothetical protein
MLMKIIRLNPGDRAPEDADRVRINLLPNGKAGWDGAIGYSNEALFGLSENYERSAADAEAEAIEWARRNGAEELFIEIG